MVTNRHVSLGLVVFLFTMLPASLRTQAGLLHRDDPQTGFQNAVSLRADWGAAADQDDKQCLDKAKDMREVQLCDEADIKRQNLRLERAYNSLLKVKKPDPDHYDTEALITSQDLWTRYKQVTCDYVGSLFYPSDMGKTKNTCEWRMTRQRADELEILLKNANR